MDAYDDCLVAVIQLVHLLDVLQPAAQPPESVQEKDFIVVGRQTVLKSKGRVDCIDAV